MKPKGGGVYDITKLNMALLASSLPIKGDTYFYPPPYTHMIQELEERRYSF